jgi:hypothetical protein
MRNIQPRILVTLVGLSMLFLGLSCMREVTNDGGAKGAAAPAPSALDASAPTFTLCNGTYALCTEATCTAIPGMYGFLSCPCSVEQDASTGQELCAAVPDARPFTGQSIPSRYAPPQEMEVCDGGAEPPPPLGWAACLDMPCVVGPDTTKATCVCVTSKTLGDSGKGAWVLAQGNYGCGTNYRSSATFAGAGAMTCFLADAGYSPPRLLGGVTWPSCDGGK